MMKKLFASLAIIIGVMVTIALISITITDYKKIYQQFLELSKIDSSLLEESDFTVKKFPTPSLTIGEVKQQGKVKLKNVEIRFSLMSWLTFSPKINDLKIGEATIYLSHNDVNLLGHDEFISELIAKNALSVQAQIKELTFTEADDDVPLVIKDLFFTSSDNFTKFTGNIDALGQIAGSFQKIGDEVLFKLEIKEQFYSFNIEEKYKNGILENGKAEIKTTSLVTKFAKLFPDMNVITDKLKSTEEVTIAFDIASADGAMIFKNIKVSSNSIEGTGEINLSKDPKNISNVKLEFNKIDFVIWNNSQNTTSAEVSKLQYVSNNSFDFAKNPMQINIAVKDLKLNENNRLSDIQIKAAIEDGKLNVQDCTGNIDQNGKFTLDGAITQNAFRSLFYGKIAVNHKDLNDFAEMLGGSAIRTAAPIPFTLSSDVKLSSVDISLQNLLIKTGDTDVVGNISTKFIGSSARTDATVKFTYLNLDKSNFPAIGQAFNYVSTLRDGMKDPEYFNKFIPIRQINAVNNFDIVVDRLTVSDKLYENVSFNLETSAGKVAITQLFLKDGDDWIDTSVTLDAQGIRPIFNIAIHDGSVAVDFLSAPAMLNLRNKILDKLDLSKIDLIMNFSLKKLYNSHFALDQVLLQANNDKNLFNISKFDAGVLGGKLQSSGSILLEPYTINFVYALNSANIQEIAKLLPDGILTSGGVLSISGMLSTNGAKLDEQLYNLYTKSNLVAKDISISNFSIDDFIQTIGIANYNVQALQEDIKKAMLTGKTKISDLQTDIELTKGIFKLPSIAFKTKYSAASGSAVFNIYDFTVDSSSIFAFYLNKPTYGASSSNYAATKMGVTAKGSLLAPKKTADTIELEAALKDRNKK